MGWLFYSQSPYLTELNGVWGQREFFPLSKESEGVLSSVSSFVFLHNGIKDFFYNPWIEFKAAQ